MRLLDGAKRDVLLRHGPIVARLQLTLRWFDGAKKEMSLVDLGSEQWRLQWAKKRCFTKCSLGYNEMTGRPGATLVNLPPFAIWSQNNRQPTGPAAFQCPVQSISDSFWANPSLLLLLPSYLHVNCSMFYADSFRKSFLKLHTKCMPKNKLYPKAETTLHWRSEWC